MEFPETHLECLNQTDVFRQTHLNLAYSLKVVKWLTQN